MDSRKREVGRNGEAKKRRGKGRLPSRRSLLEGEKKTSASMRGRGFTRA